MSQPSFLNRAFWPPGFPEPGAETSLQLLRRFRIWAVLISIAMDAGIIVTLKDASSVRTETVMLFGWINIPLLVLDLALIPLLANPRLWPWVNGLQIAIETTCIMVWIHLTGSITSYFVAAALFFFASYRFILGYRWGLIAIFTLYGGHLLIFMLHEFGVLGPAPLFRTPPVELYADAQFRWISWMSMSMLYVGIFAVCNLIIHHLRSTEAELRRAEDDLVRVARGAAHGRLTGRLLADRYQLGELLGRGGWGEVYLARRCGDDSTCAVKVLHPHLADDRESLLRFEHEATAVSRLPDEYVPKLIEIDSQGRECFIAMEYLQGEDLRARIRRSGRLPAAEVIGLVETLSAAVDAAHQAGVIHRDLKPSNVFLSHGDTQSVKLLDFGISKLQERDCELTVTSALLGSPRFMSPEQARGDSRNVTPASDLFSLGGLTYYAIGGRPPFPASERNQVLRAVLSAHPSPLANAEYGIHPHIDHVLTIAMAKVATARYATAREFAKDFAAAACGRLSEASCARAMLLVDDATEVTATTDSARRVSHI